MTGATVTGGGGTSTRAGAALVDSPSRWALPITALRVVSPSWAAIWLAVWPCSQSRRKVSTRSLVHSIVYLPERHIAGVEIVYPQYLVIKRNPGDCHLDTPKHNA